MHHGLFGHHGAHEHFTVDPAHGIFEKVQHEQIFGGGVKVINTGKTSGHGDHGHGNHGHGKEHGHEHGDHGHGSHGDKKHH